jgi:glyoxylase-like metal-dependent hydrolase (beta-lactamase superfamily II)
MRSQNEQLNPEPAPLPLADSWFEFIPAADGITLVREMYADRIVQCNIWHVRGRDRNLLIDTGLGISPLPHAAPELFDKTTIAVATHGHYDHVGGLSEFGIRAIHPLDAHLLENPGEWGSLVASHIPADIREGIESAGYVLPEVLLSAVPHRGFNIANYRCLSSTPTLLAEDGYIFDLGDRAFEVLHLPGHTPGSIALWEYETGTLFTGDIIYNGPLLDCLPGSDREAYLNSLMRLREFPVRVVYPGHDAILSPTRFLRIIIDNITRRRLRQIPRI